jgi:hypothetical protein
MSTLLGLLNTAWGNSTMLQRSGGIITDAMKTADANAELRKDSAAPLRNFAKDLDLVLATGRTEGLQLKAAQAARDMVAKGFANGLSDADWAAASLLMSSKSGTSSGLAPAKEYIRSVASGTLFGTLGDLEASLPAPWHESESELVMKASVLNARRGTALAVIDDDPTV